MAALLRRFATWAGSLATRTSALGGGAWRRSALALVLCVGLVLGGCSSAGPLSGQYVEDTQNVADQLLRTLSLEPDDPARPGAEKEARAVINDYTARYRPRNDVNGLGSFTTMQTAMNSLAGHYANYANRPLSDTLRSRIEKELKSAETSASRGS